MHTLFRSLPLAACLGLAALAGDAGFEKMVLPVMEELCVDCHDGTKPKGDAKLDTISGALAAGEDAELWGQVLEQLLTGEMPPADKDQPTESERAHVIAWIRDSMRKAGIEPPNKLEQAGYGNYVSHQALFGEGEAEPAYSPPRIWRIRPKVYDARIRGVAKDGKYPAPFTLKSGGHGFKDYDNLYRIAGPDLHQLLANADTAATLMTAVREDNGRTVKGKATPNELYALIADPDTEPGDEQLRAAIGWLHHRVLLRAPTDDETARLTAFARKSMAENGRLLGVRNLISAVLLHPDALYRYETGAGEPDEHGRTLLAGRELATALAYTLTELPPGEALLKRADAGRLATREQLAAEVRDLLENESLSRPRILGFFREYFEYGGAEDVFKDEALFRSHSPGTYVADTDQLVMHIYRQDRDVLVELLTTTKSFVQYREDKGGPARANGKGVGAHLAYNLPPDWKWTPHQPIDLPGRQRAGVLTQPAWLVAKSGNFDNDPIRRGHWVRLKLLGGTIPDIPINVDAQLPEDETKTLRERMFVTKEDYCWGCHGRMDPLGLPFERFDHFGRWRTTELDRPLDSSGYIHFGKDDSKRREVADSIEMLRLVAGSERVRQVFVRHVFRYFMGRNERRADAATLREADRAYVESGGSMKTLITSILTSDSFRYRKQTK